MLRHLTVNWGENQMELVTDRWRQAAGWKAVMLTAAEHVSMHCSALDALEHLSARSLGAQRAFAF